MDEDAITRERSLVLLEWRGGEGDSESSSSCRCEEDVEAGDLGTIDCCAVCVSE